MCVGLDPDTPNSQSLRRYRERGISHSVEDDNDLIDGVVTRRDCYLLVIGVRDPN